MISEVPEGVTEGEREREGEKVKMREMNGNSNSVQRMFQKYHGWYRSSVGQVHPKEAMAIWRPGLILKYSSGAAGAALFIFFLFFFLSSAFFLTRFLDFSYLTSVVGTSTNDLLQPEETIHVISKKPPHPKIEFPLNCSSPNTTMHQTCPMNYPSKLELDPGKPLPSTCPDYFRWIHEDLRPWRNTGITRETLESAKRTANFRLVILKGKAYLQRFKKSFQSRATFTLWGIVQLLRRYPGKVPDLELMFDCVDWPVILAKHYNRPNATVPPPLFRYCRDRHTLDLVFPDWSFWGWPEINIKPWNIFLKELKEGNKRMRWMRREPYAYWKGNPAVAATRMDLLKCNVSEKQDWNARIYSQDWIQESKQGYKQSDLAGQCIHQYKIYIEGSAWSVSEKYILACDSVTLVVKPRYFDFFSRSLMPVHHYWPIREDNKCKSIEFAVDWGNSHKQKAQAIGKAASEFIQEELKMDYVYDYMLNLLTEYAKLLRFKPEVPQDAIELCAETMACPSKGLERKFMTESLVMGPADTSPCSMPPPFDQATLHALLRRKSNSISQVEKWETDFWNSQTKQNRK